MSDYMIDTMKCVSKAGKIRLNGMFEIFGQFSKKNASNTRKAMITWAKDQMLNIAKHSSTAFLKSGDSLADWLCDMKSNYIPGDELALYCLSKMYLRHVHVHTKKLYWTTVAHTWDDSKETVMKKCELSLVYMGPGKYGEFNPIKKPTESDVTTENIPKANTNKDKTSMPGPSNVSTENNIVATENDGIMSTENTSKDIVPTTSSVENNPLGTVSTENTSKDIIPPTNVEKNPLGTVNTGNDLMLNVPNGNVHTENTGQRAASQNCQP